MRSAAGGAIVIARQLGGCVETIGRMKRVELLVSVGAGVLGVGLGAVFASIFGSIGAALIVLGVTMHGTGMWQRHQLDLTTNAALPTWTSVLYGGCWLALAVLAGYIILG